MSLVATRTEIADTPDRLPLGLGTAGSLLAHGMVLVAALFVAQPRPLPPPPQRIIDVEIVAAPAPFPEVAPAPPSVTAPTSAPLAAPDGNATADAPADTGTAAGSGQHVATRFYTATILASAAGARLRRGLATFADSERVAQLCNIEGIEQIARDEPSYKPDMLVGYAFADLMQQGLTLTAAGGAFRSRRRWYAISYSCTVGADFASVTAFSYQIGAAIPGEEWDAHSLTAEDAEE